MDELPECNRERENVTGPNSVGLLRRRSSVENLTLPVNRAFFHVPRFNVIAYSRTTDRASMLEQLDLETGECLGTLSFHPLVDRGCG